MDINGTVLVIDDTPTMAFMTKAKLKALGVPEGTIHTVSDGNEGIEEIRNGEIGLVICDQDMPRLLGHEVYDTLRQDPGCRELPFVLYTTQPDGVPAEAQEEIGRDLFAQIALKGPSLCAETLIKALNEIPERQRAYEHSL